MTLEFELIIGNDKSYVTCDHDVIMIGTLSSNQIIVKAKGVAPIHALLEKKEKGAWLLTDLGSDEGSKINGKLIDVEAMVSKGDKISLGEAEIVLRDVVKEDKSAKESAKSVTSSAKKLSTTNKNDIDITKKDLLFSPGSSTPSQGVLETVAYWEDYILDLDQFHPSYVGFEKVTIGESKKAHFIAGNMENLGCYTLADVHNNGYTLHLNSDMRARLRRDGKVQNVGAGTYNCKYSDISHVQHGAVSYFLIFKKPISVVLPKTGFADPFLFFLVMLSTIAYLVLVVGAMITPPSDKKLTDHQDAWAVVHLPQKPHKKPHIVIKHVKKKPPPPPPVKPIKEHKKPKPKPKKIKPPKVKMTHLLKPKVHHARALPVHHREKKVSGSARKGHRKISIKGVEGPKNHKPSGVNLSKLGLGVGKISSLTGVGAIHTNFKSSAGGAGGGSGSAAKGFGLGGLGNSHNLKVSGLRGGSNKFGAGLAGVVGNQAGKLGRSFKGSKRARVSVTAADPMVSGGLTQAEILAVIRAHINQIRHCYEQLLQRDPGANGKIKIKFVVEINGRVGSSKVAASTINNGSMERCVSSSLRSWQFPHPRGNAKVNVTYPFIFNPL